MITSEFELLKNQQDPANPYAVNSDASRVEEHNFTDVGVVETGAWGQELNFEIAEPSVEGTWGNEDFDIPDVQTEESMGQSEINTLTPGLTLAQK